MESVSTWERFLWEWNQRHFHDTDKIVIYDEKVLGQGKVSGSEEVKEGGGMKRAREEDEDSDLASERQKTGGSEIEKAIKSEAESRDGVEKIDAAEKDDAVENHEAVELGDDMEKSCEENNGVKVERKDKLDHAARWSELILVRERGMMMNMVNTRVRDQNSCVDSSGAILLLPRACSSR